ncbi:MAG TPA: arginine deiminase family protein [Trebonia sp.]|jgi:arginine deiminase|nr:arginine deiminase family protein [Trebonia sp.]
MMRFRGDSLSEFYGVDSEIGQLRTVLVHRPGAELRRVTPQRTCGMLLPALPWAERAQAEHDAFTGALRSRGVEVLYLTELLQDALEYAPGREQAIATAISDPRLGEELRGQLRCYLDGLRPEELGQVLVMGLARDEFHGGRGAVFSLLGAWDYVIEPLPNLVFARDTCVWIGDRVAVTSPPGRRREAELVAIATGYHPMFAGTKRLYEPDHEVLAGGDVLLLTPGVVAIGVGAHTSPAGMERLARRVFDTGFAHTVLAALTDTGTAECLDTLCTLIGPDTVMMRPSVAYSLIARTITQRDAGLWLSHPQPFLEAAAQAMGLDRLQVIETGLGPARVGPARSGSLGGPSGQWDDAGNILALGPGTVVSYERNTLTNERLEAAGVEVIRVPGGELAGCRGGPRAMSCPVSREPAMMPEPGNERLATVPAPRRAADQAECAA